MSYVDRCGQNIQFIQQSIDPRRYKTRPAPLQHPAAIPKSVDVNGNFFVPAPSLVFPVREQVSIDTGLILWYPKNGVGSIFHMGIVPANAVSTGASAGAVVAPITTPTAFVPTAQFTYTRALAVPRTQTTFVPTIAPDLAQEFSKSRQYGGLLEMWSSTISSGATSLNGTCSAFVVSDTTDVAQSTDGTDAFAVVDLAQSARTSKEVVKQVNISTGVISVQGPDINSEYAPPNAVDVDVINGGWQSIAGSVPSSMINIIGVPADSTGNFRMFGAWISPWGVSYNTGSGFTSMHGLVASGTPVPALEMDPIEEMGFVDVKFTGTLDTSNPIGTPEPSLGIVVQVVFEHFFAANAQTNDGSLAYTKLQTVSTYSGGTLASLFYGGSGSVLADYGTDISAESSVADQIASRGGMQAIGKFIGCLVSVTVSTVNTGGSPAGTGFNLNLFRSSASRTPIQVRARQLYQVGRTGPCHIMRYDNVGQDQNIRFTGILNTESVAKADIAPYVQDSLMNSRMACDANVYPLLYMLYNGVSPFKCSWIRAEWHNFVNDYVIDLSQEKLAEIADSDQRIKAAAEAAGLFSQLGKLGGNILGGLVGHPNVGSTMGGIAGSLLDSASGARGQFGVANAGGQFGITNESYSGASGQFGMRQRPY